MEVLSNLLHGFSIALTWNNLFMCLIGALVGTLTGILPGLGTVTAMVLLLPLTYGMDPTSAIIMLAGIYYGAMYGGSTTAILVNMPGEAPAVVTTFDGYQMGKKGRAGAALAIAAIGSWVAGTLGVLGIMLFAPWLARAALAFGPPEYFAIAVLGLLVLSNLTGKSVIRSILMVVVGLMVGTIGMDPVRGSLRFTIGITELSKGIDLATVTIGLFGLGEILSLAAAEFKPADLIKVRLREMYPNKEELKRSAAPFCRGGVLGFLIGLIPGPAALMASLLSYAVERKISKHPEEFGKGAVEGVAGPEAANNSASAGALVPLLALGLPFAPPAAILLSGLMIHAIIPGPMLITEHPGLFWGLIASMYIGNVMLLVLNLPLVPLFGSLVRMPPKILLPIIVTIAYAGAFSINNSLFDLWLLTIFGAIGYLMKRADFDPAPLVIGLVLGPTLERSFRQGLIMGDGHILSFFQRPISGTILIVTLSVACISLLLSFLKRKKDVVI